MGKQTYKKLEGPLSVSDRTLSHVLVWSFECISIRKSISAQHYLVGTKTVKKTRKSAAPLKKLKNSVLIDCMRLLFTYIRTAIKFLTCIFFRYKKIEIWTLIAVTVGAIASFPNFTSTNCNAVACAKFFNEGDLIFWHQQIHFQDWFTWNSEN